MNMKMRNAVGLLILVSVVAAGTHYAADQTKGTEKQKGKVVFELWCKGCHGPIPEPLLGPPPAGTYKLREKYKDSLPAVLEERKDLKPSLVKYFVRNGGFIMTPFRKTEISADELDALIKYLHRDPEGLERAAAEVDSGKTPSRLARDLPLVFSLPVPEQPGAQPEGLTAEQAKGKGLYEKACNYCHAAGRIGTLTLAKRLEELNKQFEDLPQDVKAGMEPAKRVGADQAELVKRDNLAPDYILCVVRHGVKTMPEYPPLEISRSEIDSISAYLTRNNPVEIAPVARGADCQPLEQQ